MTTMVDLKAQVIDTINHNDKIVTITLDGPAKTLKHPLYIFKTDNKKMQISGYNNLIDSFTREKILGKINPDWIESINVIKDKEATEKYGQLGQFGVVIIEFKKGTLDNLPDEISKLFTDN